MRTYGMHRRELLSCGYGCCGKVGPHCGRVRSRREGPMRSNARGRAQMQNRNLCLSMLEEFIAERRLKDIEDAKEYEDLLTLSPRYDPFDDDDFLCFEPQLERNRELQEFPDEINYGFYYDE